MPTEQNYKPTKILIFDINPSNDEITKEFVMGKILQAIVKASSHEYVIFLSHSNLTLLKEMIINMDVRNSFVISDSGARILDLKNNEIISQTALDKQSVLAVSHSGIVENNLVLLSSDKKELAYSYNFVNKTSLAKKHYIKLSCTNEYSKFSKFIENNDIYSLMIFNNYYNKMYETFEKFSVINDDWNLELQKGVANYFAVTAKNNNKFSAIKSLMMHLQITNNDDVSYFGLNVYDKTCLNSFKNTYIYQDVVLVSDALKEKNIDFKLDIPTLIREILKIINSKK